GLGGAKPPAVAAVLLRPGRGQLSLVDGGVVVDGDTQLLEVVGALDAHGRVAHSLNGRQQHADQDGDDGDDDQQLDEGEGGRADGRTTSHVFLLSAGTGQNRGRNRGNRQVFWLTARDGWR